LRRRGLLFAVFFLGLCPFALPQSLSVSVSAGGFFPKDGNYGDIYGTGLPLEFEARLGVFGNFGLAAGVSYLRQTGSAANVDQGPDSYPVDFRMVSFPVSACLLVPLGGTAALFGGAGLSVHSFKETWENVTLEHTGSTTNPFVYAGLEYGFLNRVAGRLTVRYETISAGANPFLVDEVNLGGLTVLVGVSVRLL